MASNPTILAAVDGSDQSLAAVQYLSRVISPQRAGIELLHVKAEVPEAFFDLDEAKETGDYSEQIGQWAHQASQNIQTFMQKARKMLTDAGFADEAVTVTIQPRRIGIARDIIQKANSGYSALAIGRRGYGQLADFMLGSIAAKLVETITSIPVAIIGRQPETRKILVAFDRSRSIRQGVEKLCELFDKDFKELLLCHIVRPLTMPHPASGVFFKPSHEDQWIDANQRKIIPAMVEAKKQLSEAGFDPAIFHTAILKEKTSRADGLAGEANALGFGTIIIGRHGLTRIEEFSMGRVTRKLLYLALNQAIWVV